MLWKRGNESRWIAAKREIEGDAGSKLVFGAISTCRYVELVKYILLEHILFRVVIRTGANLDLRQRLAIF